MAKPPVPMIISTVTYCCGACGYDLKLSSLARDTASSGGARRRRSVVVFEAIDDTRFGHLDEFRCLDVRSLRLFARRTRLLCRKCGAHLGYGYHEHDTAADSKPPRYHIKIRALHPASPAARQSDPVIP
ncbi:uncharacterized protein At4g08330, chloroplastic [Lolium perenne]|uniref:uncharacterized protein At4g08330, chloroplastic n=1 Tax=Lolium perenne TaxID=4522 RepID=UPI0021F53A3B|nr:uncharacterized protein At4g08330, chloroplastic-like [Lolium perenne]